MNPIASKLAPGIASWKKIAKVKFLTRGQGRTLSTLEKYKLFRIVYGKHKNAVLICTGLHLEETSGPLTLLNPKKVAGILELVNKKKLTLIIYPIVNNFGLRFPPDYDEKLLRRNEDGINYNDGWGGVKKAGEVAVVENDILKLIKKYNIKLALSLHEDSISPGKGYLWMSGLKEKMVREKIYEEVRKNVDNKLILKMKEKTILGGKVEDGLCIVDSLDSEAFEDWMAGLSVPTVLSEAPFSLSLKIRREFHLKVVEASIKAVVA